MACFHPIPGYRAGSGKITFKRSEATGSLASVSIACGQCRGCRLERSRQWAVRISHEAQTHTHNCFITLTYNDAHLPEDHSLDITHWQLFAKRFRKQEGPFRFYHCGEYGDTNGRPHYHACIFGHDFSADRKRYTKTEQGHELHTSETLDRLWGKGFCQIGELTFQSAAYVARYVMKKQNGQAAADHYDQVDTDTGLITRLKPEYASMSRRPGIGAAWISKYKTDVYPHDYVIVNGKKSRPPKFYDNQLSEFELEMLKARRATQGKKHRANNTPERLAVREEIATRKSADFLRRDL